MGRPRIDGSLEPTRERILSAAAAAFAERGPDAGLEDIAARAGIRRPSLLHHFPSKDALYEAVVRQTFADLGQALAPAMTAEPGGFPARLAELVSTFEGFLADHPHHARIVLREMLDDDGPGAVIVREQVAPLLDGVVGFLERAGAGHLRADVPVRGAVMQVVSAVLLRSAAGAVGPVMWGAPNPGQTWLLVSHLLLETP